jgi:hypothetical protein
MGAAEDVGAFGHEVDPAEYDEFSLRAAGRLLRQLQRIAPVVGELDHFVPLIMVAQDHHPAVEFPFRRGDPGLHFGLRQLQEALREGRLQQVSLTHLLHLP